MAGVAGHCVDLDVPVEGDLDGQMRGGAETVEAEPPSGIDARQAQASKSNDPCAQQWGCLIVGKFFWNLVDEVF